MFRTINQRRSDVMLGRVSSGACFDPSTIMTPTKRHFTVVPSANLTMTVFSSKPAKRSTGELLRLQYQCQSIVARQLNWSGSLVELTATQIWDRHFLSPLWLSRISVVRSDGRDDHRETAVRLVLVDGPALRHRPQGQDEGDFRMDGPHGTRPSRTPPETMRRDTNPARSQQSDNRLCVAGERRLEAHRRGTAAPLPGRPGPRLYLAPGNVCLPICTSTGIAVAMCWSDRSHLATLIAISMIVLWSPGSDFGECRFFILGVEFRPVFGQHAGMTPSIVFSAVVQQLAPETASHRRREHSRRCSGPSAIGTSGRDSRSRTFPRPRSAVQHGPTGPSRKPIVATLELEVGGDFPSDDRRPVGGELVAFVFDDADFDLPLTKRAGGPIVLVSLIRGVVLATPRQGGPVKSESPRIQRFLGLRCGRWQPTPPFHARRTADKEGSTC